MSADQQPSVAMPPPYPPPGWGSDEDPPPGYVRVWERAHEGWRVGGDGKTCCYTVGPGHATCKRPAVATLDRGRGPMAPNRWGYCEDHLYGRHLHDNALWDCALRVVAKAGGTSE
ncbi:MAG: hypothetical protein JWM02_3675 [Frankiales bacterium]|nr:hypothetical protein [Frankiales bacterium]